MWRRPRPYFGIKKGGRPIDEVPISGGVKTNITYNMSFMLWDSAIAAGATIDDLWRMENGLYSKEFLAKVIAWRKGSTAIESHTQDAISKAAKSKK